MGVACTPRSETVVILSTNDIHAHIERFPQLATAVKLCRDTVDQVILVDAGDRWTGNVYCDRAAEPRKPIVDLMNHLGYDVGTFGNHEFDAGQAFLGMRTMQFDFPIICANIHSDTVTFPQPPAYTIVERGGHRIGFVGAVTNYDHNNHPAGHDSSFVGLTFTDAIKEVASYESLRDNEPVDVLVALTHIGTKKDRELAAQVSGYDLIIGGHSHDQTNEQVNNVLITQSGKYLRNVGVTVLRFRGKQLVDKNYHLESLTDYDPDPEYAAMVEEYYNDPELRTKVVDLTASMDKRGLADLFTSAVREKTQTEIGIYHIGGVRLDSLQQQVVLADIYNLDPFGSKIATAEMTAGQLEQLVLTKFNDKVNVDESHRVDIYMTTPYVIHVDASGEAVSVTFPSLSPNKRYRVAMSDYIFKNYENLQLSAPCATDLLVTEALRDYLVSHAPYTPNNAPRNIIEGR